MGSDEMKLRMAYEARLHQYGPRGGVDLRRNDVGGEDSFNRKVGQFWTWGYLGGGGMEVKRHIAI
jgi:hypothetical protein